MYYPSYSLAHRLSIVNTASMIHIKNMTLALLLSSLSIAQIDHLLAAVGDTHTIKADNTPLHEESFDTSPILEKLKSGEKAMEIEALGEWYEVYIAQSESVGWVHKSNLSLQNDDSQTAAPNQTEQPQGKLQFKVQSNKDASPGLKKINQYLLKYNARTHVLKGYVPFTKAQETQDGNLILTISDDWLQQPISRRRTSLITLYTRWKKIRNQGDTKVIAVDLAGATVLRYPR